MKRQKVHGNVSMQSLRYKTPHELVTAHQFGSLPAGLLSRHIDERRLRKAPRLPTTVCKVMEDDPECELVSCQYLDVTSEGKMALGE